MDATAFVLLLVGLAFPIALLLAAVLFDLIVLCWAAYRFGRSRLTPRLALAMRHVRWTPRISVR